MNDSNASMQNPQMQQQQNQNMNMNNQSMNMSSIKQQSNSQFNGR